MKRNHLIIGGAIISIVGITIIIAPATITALFSNQIIKAACIFTTGLIATSGVAIIAGNLTSKNNK